MILEKNDIFVTCMDDFDNYRFFEDFETSLTNFELISLLDLRFVLTNFDNFSSFGRF